MQPKPSKPAGKTLLEAFTELPDPRVIGRCDHLLHEVLVIAVCGMLVGGESFYDMEDFASESESWLRGFLLLPGGVPRHDTFNRVFQALCPHAFAECFARWTQGVREPRMRGLLPVVISLPWRSRFATLAELAFGGKRLFSAVMIPPPSVVGYGFFPSSRNSAACATSLSPRPLRFAMMSWSGRIFGARLITASADIHARCSFHPHPDVRMTRAGDRRPRVPFRGGGSGPSVWRHCIRNRARLLRGGGGFRR